MRPVRPGDAPRRHRRKWCPAPTTRARRCVQQRGPVRHSLGTAGRSPAGRACSCAPSQAARRIRPSLAEPTHVRGAPSRVGRGSSVCRLRRQPPELPGKQPASRRAGYAAHPAGRWAGRRSPPLQHEHVGRTRRPRPVRAGPRPDARPGDRAAEAVGNASAPASLRPRYAEQMTRQRRRLPKKPRRGVRDTRPDHLALDP